jgi:hypothetical protein
MPCLYLDGIVPFKNLTKKEAIMAVKKAVKAKTKKATKKAKK